MNSESTATGNSFCETVTKIIRPCLDFIYNFTFGHPVHPLEPSLPQFSEYLLVDNRRKLRIICIKPTTSIRNEFSKYNKSDRKRLSRNSAAEEYWFTQWNKPLRVGICNCSFRRSQRFSFLSNQSLRLSVYQPNVVQDLCEKDDLSNYNSPPTKITNIETFVERLIQETLYQVLQEYFIKCSKKNLVGIDNLSYENDDKSDGVVLRNAFKNKEKQDDTQETSSSNKNKCTHATEHAKKKPIVLLLHGIGSTADIWWNIINTLVYKGYEILAPDMLGHGYSSVPDNPEAYKFKNLLKYTLTVFDRYIGCDESNSCIVIGHSYGCSIATALCRYRSRQIIQLILISGGGPTPLAPPAQNETAFLNCTRTFLRPLLICGVKRTIFYSLRGKHFDVCNQTNAVPNYILKYIINGQNWPEGDAAFHRRILIPTLLVHGLQDIQITLVQECEMERTIPRAFLELIPNAGHMSMLETPEHLGHMIMCFIDWWSR